MEQYDIGSHCALRMHLSDTESFSLYGEERDVWLPELVLECELLALSDAALNCPRKPVNLSEAAFTSSRLDICL